MATKSDQIFSYLNKEYPFSGISLDWKTPWQLLVATILSAQCTDERVNMVTKNLFKKYKSIDDFGDGNLSELEQDIRPTGFFRNKAKNIRGAAKKIIADFNGKVPSTMEDMLTLPGVARKTANVVLNNAFKQNSGIPVDTHIIRVCNRLGLTKNKDPVKIEQDLMKIVPKSKWRFAGHRIILHGRKICDARKPKCDECGLKNICPSAYHFPHFK